MDLKEFFEKRFVFQGLDEHLRPAIARGKGAIILGAHMGNPELAVQAMAHVGIPVFALTEPVHPRVSKLMDRHRASQGLTFAPVSVGSVKRVFQTLKRGGVVALMGDRDIEGPKEKTAVLRRSHTDANGPDRGRAADWRSDPSLFLRAQEQVRDRGVGGRAARAEAHGRFRGGRTRRDGWSTSSGSRRG